MRDKVIVTIVEVFVVLFVLSMALFAPNVQPFVMFGYGFVVGMIALSNMFRWLM